MAKPESHEREAFSPESSPAEQRGVTTDTKIQEIERHLESRSRGAEAQARDASEAAIHEAQARELAEFGERARDGSEKKSRRGLVDVGKVKSGEQKLTAQWLREHADDPDAALAALQQLATSQRGGLEKAKKLLEKIAADKGGAAIVDSFHSEIQKIGKPKGGSEA